MRRKEIAYDSVMRLHVTKQDCPNVMLHHNMQCLPSIENIPPQTYRQQKEERGKVLIVSRSWMQGVGGLRTCKCGSLSLHLHRIGFLIELI